MKSFVLKNESTQKEILTHLKDTEILLSKVATKLSNRECEANIYAMPDLGIPSNSTRVAGGFFTGMCATWETDIPFIPIDSTVNVCGVICYKLKNKMNAEELRTAIERTKKSTMYNFNYDSGNHFIILSESDGKGYLEKGQYLILHASAAEYKKDNLFSGLYPVKGNWYYDKIETEYLENGRYLRYIKGETAQRFYEIANMLKGYNKIRNRDIALSILGDKGEKEILNVSHYGMPDINSVCIGCQWKDEIYTLLTANGKNIYIVKPSNNKKNTIKHNKKKLTLSLHGLGVKLKGDEFKIELKGDSILLNGKKFALGEKINIGSDTLIRASESTPEELDVIVNNVLSEVPGNILGKLSQIACYNKDGFKEY